jgi:adenylylsulfate kinase-like enzyme
VICATVSGFHDVQAYNRATMPRYVEIWVTAPEKLLHQRNNDGWLVRGRRGEASNVVGVDQPFEAPIQPEYVVQNTGSKASLYRAAEGVALRWAEGKAREFGGKDR